MRRKILTVEETFKITGRGLIIVGEFDFNSVTIKIGNAIIIVRPNGEELNLFIKGLEFFSGVDRSSPLKYLPLWVGDIDTEDIPIGSEVFIEE
jgi:hypothetical protein